MTVVATGVAHESPSPAAHTREPSTAVTGAAWLAVGAVASKASQTLVLLVFAAVLEPDAFGVISLGAVLLNVTTVLADLGTSTALVHFRGDAERAARSAVTLALATSLGLVALVWTAAPWVARHLQAGQLGTDMLRGVVLCVPLAAVAGVSGELLRRALDFRRRVIPDIVGNAVGAAATIGALASGQGALSLVYGQLAQAFVVLLLFWSLRPPVRPGWSRNDASKLVSYGASLAGGSLLTLIMLNVDYVVIANRLGVHEVGIYSMAFRVAYMPYLLIAMVIGGAVFAHLCRMRGATIGRAMVDAAVVLHALAIPAYVGVLVFAPQLQLLGEQWAPAVPALRWLAGYGLVLSALELLLVSLKSIGRTSDILGLTALHLVVLVTLLAAYVDRGVTAAAVAQFVAGAMTLVTAVGIVSRRVPGTDWALLARRLTPVAAGALALAGTALLLQQILPWARVSAIGLVLVGLCSVTAYVATVLVLDPDDHTGVALIRGLVARRYAAGLVGVLVVAGVGAGALAVVAPYPVLVVLVTVAVVAAATVRVEWIAIGYVIAEPFGDLLREVHPAAIKVIGGLLFVSWLVRLVHDPRPAGLRHPGIYALGALLLTLLASFVVHGADLATGMDHAVTYVSYALLVVVLVDTVRRGRPDPPMFARRLVTAFALSCTAAGVVAVIDFLAHGGRGSGPLTDPNDLAFFMIAALPFVLVVGRRSPVTTYAFLACGAVLVVATFTTLSRGALLALAVMVVVAVLLGALRLTTALSVGVVAAVALGVLWATHADVVAQSLAEKEHIAAVNVDLRSTTWTMAADMTADSPLLGQGPGGFEAASSRFVPEGVAGVQQTVAHQMYLDLSAELGLLGLAAFLAVLAYGARGAVRARAVPERRSMANAVLIACAGALVAACFLSEQFYLPIWLLVALGIALDPVTSARSGRS
jgi:O-antigen/teichoic acid export membrane protein/O-antigen ligase